MSTFVQYLEEGSTEVTVFLRDDDIERIAAGTVVEVSAHPDNGGQVTIVSVMRDRRKAGKRHGTVSWTL